MKTSIEPIEQEFRKVFTLKNGLSLNIIASKYKGGVEVYAVSLSNRDEEFEEIGQYDNPDDAEMVAVISGRVLKASEYLTRDLQ